MTKTSKITSTRDARSGAFVERGAKVGKFTAMGTAADGTIIIAPKLKPKDFTVREIRDAVRAVKEEERQKQVSGTTG